MPTNTTTTEAAGIIYDIVDLAHLILQESRSTKILSLLEEEDHKWGDLRFGLDGHIMYENLMTQTADFSRSNLALSRDLLNSVASVLQNEDTTQAILPVYILIRTALESTGKSYWLVEKKFRPVTIARLCGINIKRLKSVEKEQERLSEHGSGEQSSYDPSDTKLVDQVPLTRAEINNYEQMCDAALHHYCGHHYPVKPPIETKDAVIYLQEVADKKYPGIQLDGHAMYRYLSSLVHADTYRIWQQSQPDFLSKSGLLIFMTILGRTCLGFLVTLERYASSYCDDDSISHSIELCAHNVNSFLPSEKEFDELHSNQLSTPS